jgi:hypothetical protein
LEVTVNKYLVLGLECGDGRGWDCVEEVTHATLSAFLYYGISSHPSERSASPVRYTRTLPSSHVKKRTQAEGIKLQSSGKTFVLKTVELIKGCRKWRNADLHYFGPHHVLFLLCW